MNKLTIKTDSRMSLFLAQNGDYEPFIDFILDNIDIPPRFIMDFGCQKTPLIDCLQDANFEVSGIDTTDAESFPLDNFNADDLIQGIEVARMDCIFSVLGLSSFALGTEGLDRIALMKLAEVLSNDGKILLVLPYGEGDDHIRAFHRFYTQEGLAGLLEGFSVSRIDYLFHNTEQRIWVNVNEEIAGRTVSNMIDGVKAVALVVASK